MNKIIICDRKDAHHLRCNYDKVAHRKFARLFVDGAVDRVIQKFHGKVLVILRTAPGKDSGNISMSYIIHSSLQTLMQIADKEPLRSNIAQASWRAMGLRTCFVT